jgi:phosphoribosyl 1,2-cyclic phosphodiesterase
MKVRFWGVRGSCPTPLSTPDIQAKIISVVNRIKLPDIKDKSSREKFLSKLPIDIFGTTGGNTSCVEIRLSDNSMIILDCGTGLLGLYQRLIERSEIDNINEYHIFISHFHYDHLMGIPYFVPFFQKNKTINFYSPYVNMEKILRNFLRKPYHPVGFEVFAAKVNFITLNKEPIRVGSGEINWIKRTHPDGTIAYGITEGDRRVIYSTDTELEEKNFKMTRKNKKFFYGADMIILDSQYTLEESIEKISWGHSSFSMAIEFAQIFKIKGLYLFHHEPSNNDEKVLKIEKMARNYQSHLLKRQKHKLHIELAREGVNVEI